MRRCSSHSEKTRWWSTTESRLKLKIKVLPSSWSTIQIESAEYIVFSGFQVKMCWNCLVQVKERLTEVKKILMTWLDSVSKSYWRTEFLFWIGYPCTEQRMHWVIWLRVSRWAWPWYHRYFPKLMILSSWIKVLSKFRDVYFMIP